MPFQHLEGTMHHLLDMAKEKPFVVFHCHYSQTRGPNAALSYLDRAHDVISCQAVLVLEGGFKAWHTQYRDDPALYERL